MKTWLWLRGLAVILLLFAVGHTLGTAAPRARRGPREAAVFDAMQSFRFPIMGFDRTYWDFYKGFAITISLLLPALAAVAWQASSIAKRNGRDAMPMAITLWLASAGLLVLGVEFFFAGPIVMSVVAVLLATAAVATAARTPAIR